MKEEKIEIYKRIFFLHHIGQTSIVLILLSMIFNGIYLLKQSPFEVLEEALLILLVGALIGCLFGKRKWDKFHQVLEEKISSKII